MSPRLRALFAFRSAVILLLFCFIAATVTLSRFLVAQQWVSHTHEVQSELFQLGSISTRAGRARTEFVDNANASYLEEFHTLRQQLPPLLEHIGDLVRDNPAQHENYRALQDLTNRRLDLLDRSMDLKQAGSADGQAQVGYRREILDVSREADTRIQMMVEEEQALLEMRIQRSRSLLLIVIVIVGGVFIVAFALLLLHYRLLMSELQAREHAQESLRSLSARLLQVQDEERRRFSRELHDSIGQYLAALKMNLANLAASIPGNDLIDESMTLIDQSMSETRTISHLLHPPLLDEAGFASAAGWYVQGFSQRSGIRVKFNIAEDFPRLPQLVELALFRILQEGLTNIHRHSKSSEAEVGLEVLPGDVVLKITDRGKGIPAQVLERFRGNGYHVGVGLAGMRERVRELGGHLEVDSQENLTQIIATLPRSHRSSAAQTDR